jgi:hypothetical protein
MVAIPGADWRLVLAFAQERYAGAYCVRSDYDRALRASGRGVPAHEPQSGTHRRVAGEARKQGAIAQRIAPHELPTKGRNTLRYSALRANVADDHISRWEYSGYRFLRVAASGGHPLCAGCLSDRAKKLFDEISDRKDVKAYRKALDLFMGHLAPFPSSDQALIERGFRYCEKGNLELLKRLSRMSYVISQIRIGEAFNSPVLLEDSDLSKLPVNISVGGNEARAQAAKINKMVADGLGISIPTEIRLESYIELVKDYQPRISSAIRAVLGSESTQASIADASKSIIAINSEIERIKNLRRYTVLEAGISFYKNNSTLVNGTLLAGALGLTGSLVGCVATGGAAFGAKIAKSKGWLKSTEATERMRRMVARDLQPAVDLVLKSYLGAKAPAINVLSIQKRISSVSQEDAVRKSA